jgi:hypothetical protein
MELLSASQLFGADSVNARVNEQRSSHLNLAKWINCPSDVSATKTTNTCLYLNVSGGLSFMNATSATRFSLAPLPA